MICPTAHKAQGLGEEKQTGLHHIKQQVVYCSHSVSAETHMTFSCFMGEAARMSSSLVHNNKQKVADRERESLPPVTGCSISGIPLSGLKTLHQDFFPLCME